jgi:anti-sigma B factor antagonist
MKISTSPAENEVTLVEVTGDVDGYTAPSLNKALNDVLTKGHSRLLLDASQIEFLSSAGLRVLTSAQREARRLGGEVRLFGLSARVRKVFEMSGLVDLFYVADTREQAMEGWGDANA